MPICERCGRENPDEARFCNGCGAEFILERLASSIRDRARGPVRELDRTHALLTTLAPPTREVTPHEPLA